MSPSALSITLIMCSTQVRKGPLLILSRYEMKLLTSTDATNSLALVGLDKVPCGLVVDRRLF